MARFKEEDNPYTLQFSFIPPKFIERRNDTDTIISNFVRPVPTYRGMFITGVRGSGKTVMLSDIRNKIGAMKDWIAVDINPETDLVHTLVSKLYRIPKLRTHFIKAKLDFSAMGLGVSIEDAKAVAYNDDDVLEIMLEALKKKGLKLLVTIDEIMYSSDVARFSHALSSYAGEDYDIYVLMTGLRKNINRIKNKPSLTFLYRAKVMEIDSLNTTAISAEYQKTLALKEEDADRLAIDCRGYSLAFQIIGHVYWNVLSRYESIDEADPLETDNEVDVILAELAYDKIFDELSPKDIEVLKAMVHIIRESGKDSAKVEEIRKAVSMTPETFSSYRKRLLDNGILDGKQYGYLRFRLPRFENYVRIRG